MKRRYLIFCFFIYALPYVQTNAARPERIFDMSDIDSIYKLIRENNKPDRDYNHKEDVYDYLYRSLYYDKQLENHPDPATDILLALTEEASIREDTVSIKQLLAKAEKLQQALPGEYKLKFVINALYASLYKVRYSETLNEALLDTILLYENKSIALYQSGKLKDMEMDIPISLTHIQIAEYELKRENPDFIVINQHIKSAEELAGNETDPLPYICISYVQSLVYYAAKNMEQAELQASITNELIDNYRRFGYQELYANNYTLLSKINETKGDYKNALKYEELKSNYELEIHNNEIKTIELQIITETKNAEVSNLKTQNEFYKKRSALITVICILLFITIILLLAFFYVKRKNIEHLTALEKKAKEDAELRLKLKNEQAEKALLEKYDVLSDFHLKEMELMGKSKELEELEKEKRKLDEQVELFAKKTAEYENLMCAGYDNSKELPMYEIIKEDLEQLINKHLKNRKNYIEKLCHLNEACVKNIKDRYDGNISVQYIKYCICFTIGMEIAEVSACFSIEQASVHGLRYRLKKKFGLGPDDSLELFLISLNANTVSIKTKD
ncbi:MAG: hypothetical protein LBF05_04230 [Tannerella sp.]|jgi:hypothetical protein|nr:hypothetical protein [Tannerella sp.]